MTRLTLAFYLALACCVAAPAFAADGPPEAGYRYKVIGVVSGDSLNVRNGAGTEANVIAALPSHAVGLSVSGRQQQVSGSTWWEILLGSGDEAMGWVNARFLAKDPAHDMDDTDYPLACQGTEPFWSLAIDGAVATGDAYILEGQSFAASTWQQASGLRDWFAVFLAPTEASPSNTGVVTITRSTCSDGMSDLDYPFLSTLVLPDRRVFGGCCYRSAN